MMNEKFELMDKKGDGVGLEVEAFEVPGKIALWLKMSLRAKILEPKLGIL